MNVGQIFGRWTVLGEPTRRSGQLVVAVRCECGLVVDRYVKHLETGATTMCKKCSFKSRQKSNTPEYEAWLSLIQRCTNPKNPRSNDYGGRGISVCARWRESFDAFLADVGPRPGAEYSIDRRDNNGHYEPGNCRWATRPEQQSNQRRRRPRSEAVHA